jgi:hypothetical protein
MAAKDKPFELRARHRTRGSWLEAAYADCQVRNDAAIVLAWADRDHLGSRVEIRDDPNEPWRPWRGPER